MPFDITIPARGSWNLDALTPHQRLEKLRDFLRTPIASAYWDYRDIEVDPDCGTNGCAMGWYYYLANKSMDWRGLKDDLGLDFDTFDNIFYNADGMLKRLSPKYITPEDVADLIDQHLEEVYNG